MPEPTVPPVTPESTKQPDLAPGGKPWKEAWTELVTDRDVLKERVRTFDAELQSFRQKEAERSKAETQTKEQMERTRLEAEGNYKQALQNAEQKWQSKLEETRRATAERLVPLAIKTAALSVKGLTPEAVNDLPKLLADVVSLDPDKLEVFVKGPDGKPLMDEKLNQVSLENYLQQFASGRPYLLADGLPTRHGQSPGAKGTTMSYEAALGDRKLMAQWEQSDPDGLKAAEQAYYSPAAVKARTLSGMGIKPK
jgi:hypothetical protein